MEDGFYFGVFSEEDAEHGLVEFLLALFVVFTGFAAAISLAPHLAALVSFLDTALGLRNSHVLSEN